MTGPPAALVVAAAAPHGRQQVRWKGARSTRGVFMSEQHMQYEAVWPLGKSHWDKRDLNPGIGDLNGKTIAEVWDRVFRGEEVFPAIREAIRKKYPGVRFVEYDTFGDPHGVNQKQVLADLPAKLREHKIDAVISGVGA
jgi:hypothetical protein